MNANSDVCFDFFPTTPGDNRRFHIKNPNRIRSPDAPSKILTYSELNNLPKKSAIKNEELQLNLMYGGRGAALIFRAPALILKKKSAKYSVGFILCLETLFLCS